MIDILSNFQKNKLTFLTAGFSVFTFLKDIEDTITHFFENIKFLFLAFCIISAFLIYNFFNTRKSNTAIVNESLSSSKEIDSNKNNQNFIKKYFLKIAFALCTAFVIIGFLSLSLIRNYPIYYVKVKAFKTESEAISYMNSINSRFESKSIYNLKARCLTRSSNPNKYKDGNYMITINRGYLTESNAESKLKDAKLILGNQINLCVTKPTRNISIRKKIIYLMENN
jgi:hypothetical protein